MTDMMDCECRDCPKTTANGALCEECEHADCARYPLYQDADLELEADHATRYACKVGRVEAEAQARLCDFLEEDRCETQTAYDAAHATSFDMHAALYWFATDYHNGQSSDLYALLSRSPYQPAMTERSPANGVRSHHSEETQAVYQALQLGWVDPFDLEAFADALYDYAGPEFVGNSIEVA